MLLGRFTSRNAMFWNFRRLILHTVWPLLYNILLYNLLVLTLRQFNLAKVMFNGVQ